MSDPVSALNNAADTSGLVSVKEIGPLGMLTLRGDLSDKAFAKAVASGAALVMPEVRQVVAKDATALAWMTPDELLLICDYKEVQARKDALSGALTKQHALVANVSDARAVFEVQGDAVRDVIAKLAPVDMHPDHFKPGMFRRTRFAQVPAAFWLLDDTTARIICFRSVARYMFDILNMAGQSGSEVETFSV